MSTGNAIKVEGLREFVRALKAMDRELPKALRLAFNAAADIVVDDAQPRIPVRSGTAAASVKARSTQTSARVVGGGNRAPYYPWLDFGGRVGRRHSVSRPFLTDGRYIYNAFFRKREKFVEAMQDGLVTVVEGAGIKVD
jgi:hypothetical protein